MELQALRAEHADVLKEQNAKMTTANEKNEELEKQLKAATEEAEKLRQEAAKVRFTMTSARQYNDTYHFPLDKVSLGRCRQS